MSKDRLLSVTEAARNFADLINRAFYRGESATLLRNGTPVARVTPPAPPTRSAHELARRWETLPHLTPEEAADFATDLEAARRELPSPADPWESS